jgi:hypothetical protein
VTHVVTAVSIGAFRLMAGGSSKIGGGVSAGSLGGSGSSERSEQTLREAGDPTACVNATDQEPANGCGSPIQVFLTPVARALTEHESKLQELDKKAKQSDGVQITFETPSTTERWTLRGADADVLCDLPCTRWVPPASGYYIQKEEANAYRPFRLDVPESFRQAPGSSVKAQVSFAAGNRPLASLGIVAGGAVAAAGAAAAYFALKSPPRTCYYGDGSQSSVTGDCPASQPPTGGADSQSAALTHYQANLNVLLVGGLVAAGVGTLGLIGGFYYQGATHGDRFDIGPETADSRSPRTPRITALGPGLIRGDF